MLPVSLCAFVKNESHSLSYMLSSIQEYVSEIILVDTGSTDDTMKIAKAFGARTYRIEFSDFGSLRTITSHLARQPWVLMLDADETMSNQDGLADLIQLGNEAYAFPRKRWLDLEMTQQTELEAYPDWQVRLYKNDTRFVWKRELHEFFHGGVVTHVDNGPIINHFQDVFKDSVRWEQRRALYERLAPIAKVTIEGGKPI